MTGRPVAIAGWGSASGIRVVANSEFEQHLDTSDDWIAERTGIRERRVGGTVSQLATDAGRRALGQSGIDPATIELLIVATSTPDHVLPASSAAVHYALGLSGGAYDLNAACAGFVYGILAGHHAVATGTGRVLVIGADILSQIVDPDDRATAVLFGDGAGAVILEATTGEDRFLGWDSGVDGSAYDLLLASHGGHIVMEGREIFKRAVRVTVLSAIAALEQAKCTVDDIALFIPHQANLRIITAVAQRLGIGPERTVTIVEHTGNTSSASIPMAMAHAAERGRLADGDLVLMSGFGAGMSWASAVVRWGR